MADTTNVAIDGQITLNVIAIRSKAVTHLLPLMWVHRC